MPRRLRPALLAALAAALLAAAPRALACSVCGCGDPLLDATDPAASQSKLRLQLNTEYVDVKAGNEEDPALVDRLRQYTLELQAVYAPLDRLALIATVPFTRKELSAAGSTAKTTGLGDVEIAARYALLDFVDMSARRRHTFGVSAGTSLPTGSDHATDAAGNHLDHHAQIGTGAWGPFAGLHYRFAQDDWQVLASLAGRLRTTNHDGYKYGNSVLWGVHGQYQVHRAVALDLGVDGRYVTQDRDNGPVPHTGGTVLAVSPGVFWNVSGPFWLSGRAQIPFFKDLVGVQDVNPTFLLGLQYQMF